ncbi:MAG: hypothetical protein WCP45_15215 [Verrucomicrobiota bacterium]
MSKKLSAWQRERVSILHTAFSALAASMQTEGTPLVASLEALQRRLDGQALGDGKHEMRASFKTLVRLWYQWDKGGRKATALAHQHASPKHVHMLPDLLIKEVQRLATVESGARDIHQNGVESKAVWKDLARRWRAGESLPGVGPWQEWWAQRHPTLPLPNILPDFPWCPRTISRASGAKVLKRLGNVGHAAAIKHLPSMQRDYSKLRKCELYTLDDVRLDFVAIDEITGRVVELLAYILIEVASRSIVAFLVKPVDAIKAADVDELLAHGLQADGYGVGVGYQTHIWFERGTVACSEAAQRVLESFSDGAIKIHRTSMDGGMRWVGAAADKASGHSAGKAVIESFNRNLHRRTLHLPGQRGNNYSNQPANLGMGDKSAKDASKSDRRTAKFEAEKLAQFKLTAMAAGADARIKLPFCTCTEAGRHVAKAVKDHNTERGHSMQGFHRITEAELAPDVWQEVDSN